jgi:hypothetical protein
METNFSIHLPTLAERKYIQSICTTYGLGTIYVWQTLLLWLRVRPHVVSRGVPPIIVTSFLELVFHLALLWIGPQTTVSSYRNHVPHKIVKAMIRSVCPNVPTIRNYQDLQVHVFLVFLDGMCS